MKMKQMKNFSILSANILFISSFLPLFNLFAYGKSTTKDSIGSINQEDDGISIGIDETQTQKTTYSENIENEGIQGSDVYVSQASTFGVTIPKTIILDGKVNENGINKANYIVTISNESNFAGNERIKVIPETNFKMSQEGKNDINVSVLQDKEEWKYNELDVKGNGEISTNEMSAGIWKGIFYFNIELDSSFIKVEAFDKNGTNLNASAKEIKGEEKEQLLNYLENSNLVSSKNEVDLLIDVKTNNFEDMATITFDVSNVANENDIVVILHFNKETNEWEYISTENVNSEGKITTNMSSFSPIAFVKVNNDNSYSKHECTYNNHICLGCNSEEPGLYDANGIMLCTWEESGINLEYNHPNANSAYYSNNSGYWVLNNKYPTTAKMIFPTNINQIGNYCFYNYRNTNLTTIIIPGNIKNIGDYCFYNVDGIITITMKEGVETIGVSAFQAHDNLTTVNFPNSIKTISNCAFASSGKLTNLKIPKNVIIIDHGAFQNLTLIYSLTIPKNVERIGKYAFGGCENLTNVEFEDQTDWYVGYNYDTANTYVDVTNNSNAAYYLRYGNRERCWVKK